MYWDWGTSLNERQKRIFRDNYPGFLYDAQLGKKVIYRTRLINLLGIIWAATRIAEIKQGLVPKSVSSGISRYENVINYILSKDKHSSL